MRKIKTYLTSQELAEVLPKMYDMRQQGDTLRYIGNKYDLSEPTVSHYLIEYKSYLSGGQVRQIARAIPYLVVNQSVMTFTEEKGRQPEQHGVTRQTMKIPKYRLTGKELAEILPKMYIMYKRGMNNEDISKIFKIGHSTVRHYMVEYEGYMKGGKARRIARAIPYLVVQQAKVKFTEEQGRQPEQRGSYTKPKQQEVKRTQVIVLWGLLKINW